MTSVKEKDVSIIIPIYNGSSWIDRCFNSILTQTAVGIVDLEICVCNDSSTDNTADFLMKWKIIFESKNVTFKVYDSNNWKPLGVGFAKNKAISVSEGMYLCFQDIDDLMLPDRILAQYKAANNLENNTIVGSKFTREPDHSTERYTKWANCLTEEQLNIQIYTSNGPTVIMPTWFCHHSVFERVGGFSEEGTGVPEDLIFFYKHIELGGKVYRVDEFLLVYTYHENATTFSIHENTIWSVRVKFLQETVLRKWPQFTIWNAGKQGRKLYKSLSEENQKKVTAFCDVDKNKIGKSYKPFDEKTRRNSDPIDIVHFSEAEKPFIICIKLDMTGGDFEGYLASLNIQEGVDYVLFS